MGIWNEYVEKYNTYGGPLLENSPPNGAVGTILIVMGLGVLLYRFRRGLRLSPPELVVIYSALLIAAPLMTQGLWGRMFGLLAAIPNNEDFKSYESLPPMLWPHGRNLVGNGRFEQDLRGFRNEGDASLTWVEMDRGRKGKWRSPKLSHGDRPGTRSWLSLELPRTDAQGRPLLVPGERFLFSMLVKAEKLQKNSFYFMEVRADSGIARTLLLGTGETKPSLANPGGFERVGVGRVSIPDDMKQRLELRIGLAGPGEVTFQDVQFLNVEATEGLYSGRKVVHASQVGQLGPHERDFTLVRPDNLWSVAGLKYLLRGYIPLRQWLLPAAAWTALIGGIFIGLMGLNLLMRKQWAENERFSFPLTILPKNLFFEEDSGTGQLRYPIFHNRAMWIGFACTLPLVALKGLHFYNPSVPALIMDTTNWSLYVTSPLAKAFLYDMNPGAFWFSIVAIALLIETNVLFSLWSFFVIFQLWNLFGPMFNFNRFPGYPWRHQQNMGAFIAYAAIAIVVGRRHLKGVFRKILGLKAEDDASGDGAVYRTGAIMVLGSLVMLGAWGIWTQMGLLASLLFFGYMLVLGFAASKIRAETGAPFAYMTPYFGMQFVAAVGGFAVFKSTGMLVATIAAGFMCTSCFLLMAPAQVEMMELGRHFNVRRRDIGSGLTIGLLGGLFIGGFVVLCWAYGLGGNNLQTSWPYEQNWYFSQFRTGEASADRALEAGTLLTAPETAPLNLASNLDAKGMGLGVLITVILATLRSLFMWFPLHPLGYVLASTHFMQGFWLTAFGAWLVRMVVFRIGGAQTIRRGLVPFSVGMFLACITSIMVFDLLGLYLKTRGVVDVYTAMP